CARVRGSVCGRIPTGSPCSSCSPPTDPAERCTPGLSEQDGGELADLPEAGGGVGAARGLVVVVDVERDLRGMVPPHLAHQLRHPGAAQAAAAVRGTHPYPVDLGDRSEERADVGLEPHLALL